MAESDVESDTGQSVAVVTTHRQYGLYCCGLVASFVLLAVVIIVSVIALVEGRNFTLVFSILLVLLILVAIATGGFFHWQRRRAARRRDQSAKDWIHRTISQAKINEPDTSAETSAETARTSWAFWRKTSSTGSSASGRAVNNVQQTVAPSAPPQSARSSWAFWRKSSPPNRGLQDIPQPSAPPQSTRSSWAFGRKTPSSQGSQGPPAYQSVATSGDTVMPAPPS